MKKKHLVLLLISLSSLFNISSIFASNDIEAPGGLKFGGKDNPYSFEISGTIKFDQGAFMDNAASKGSEFYNGANFRDFELDLNGGLGKDLSYSIITNYDATNSKVKLDDAYLTHSLLLLYCTFKPLTSIMGIGLRVTRT